jgi:ferric-dicitrate binding protein FerR (iron transport regulator)
MKKNLLFTADELLLDERFLSWVEGVVNEDDNQWVNSLIAYSEEQEDEVAEALALHRALRLRLHPSEGLPQQQTRLLLQLDRLEGQVGQTKISKTILTAAFFVAVLTGLFWWNQTTLQGVTEKMRATAKDSRTLSDGTQVKLASNSTITLSPAFDDAPRREVWVKGEVEFVVQKKKDKKPFIVHMDPFDVVVTGTAFQATHLPQRSSVLLREGSVELIFKDGQRLHLSPGDFYTYNRPVIAGKEEPGLVQQEPVLERKIVFEDLAISDVAAQIESRYPVKIIIASAELANRRITGILPNDNLDVLINALQIATESVSKQQGATIVFTPQ